MTLRSAHGELISHRHRDIVISAVELGANVGVNIPSNITYLGYFSLTEKFTKDCSLHCDRYNFPFDKQCIGIYYYSIYYLLSKVYSVSNPALTTNVMFQHQGVC